MMEGGSAEARRRRAALEAIQEAIRAGDDENEVIVFLTHHLDEIESDYWVAHSGKPRPSLLEIASLLIAVGDDEDDAESLLDLSLPGGVTDYVLAVEFDEDGEVVEIFMES